MTTPAPRTRSPRFTTALLEALEPRTLLSVAPFAKGTKGGTNFDLTPTAIGIPSLKSALVAGTADTGTISVTVANTGTDASKSAVVTVYLRPSTGGPDINITKASGKVKKVNGNATAHALVKLNLSASLAAGNYGIVVKLNSNDTNAGDNTVLIPTAVFTINPGSSALGASITADTIPLTLDASATKTGSLSVAFKNTGTSPSPAASVTATLVLHPASGADITLIAGQTYSVPALKPAASAKPVAINLPSLASVPAGSYTPILTLTPTGFSNNTPIVITSPIPVTITGGTVTPPTTGLLLHGDVLAFTADTQLTGGNFLETGSFTTNTHASGNYRYAPGTLTLTYSDGSSELIDVLPIATDSVTFLDPTLDGNPTTVTFNTDSTGAFASSLGLGADDNTTGYLHH